MTQETVRAFLKGAGPITSGWHQKHYTLAGLFRFAMQRGLVSTSPVAYRLPKRPAYAPTIRRAQRTWTPGAINPKNQAPPRFHLRFGAVFFLRRRTSPRRGARAHPR